MSAVQGIPERIANLINARLALEVAAQFDKLFTLCEDPKPIKKQVIIALEQSVNTPRTFEDYKIPEHIEASQQKMREVVQYKLDNFEQSGDMTPDKLKNFLITEHELLKYAQNQWFYTNPGTALEVFRVPLETNAALLHWLQREFGVEPGDEVVHRHAISNNGRQRLLSLGFSVPHQHWDRQYVVDGLEQVATLLASNPKNKGLLALGSWLYNPANYKRARDGRSIVAFTFLSDDRLVGHRFSLGIATPQNEFCNQYAFATRNPRRKALAERDEFQPAVYATFYPRENLLENFL